MTSEQQGVDREVVQRLSEATQESMQQLQDISRLEGSEEEAEVVYDLGANGQTYLVFLEECAQNLESGKSVDSGILKSIQNHCYLVNQAWLEMGAGLEIEETA